MRTAIHCTVAVRELYIFAYVQKVNNKTEHIAHCKYFLRLRFTTVIKYLLHLRFFLYSHFAMSNPFFMDGIWNELTWKCFFKKSLAISQTFSWSRGSQHTLFNHFSHYLSEWGVIKSDSVTEKKEE